MAKPGASRRGVAPRAFTIVELLVALSIIALLVAILLPALGRARDAAMQTQSAAHLRNMSVANAAYAADWSDRQWTAVPDDAGLFNGDCAAYVAVACPPQLILGWNEIGQAIGYFIGQGKCAQYDYPGNCGNWAAYVPINWGSNASIGSFRLPNAKSFNTYLNGRFYDPVFYAPKDTLVYDSASKWFGVAAEFTTNPAGTEIHNSSYCFSPAAMWSPEVLACRNNGWRDPNTLPTGYKSPAAGQAAYPDLKTRMLEHHWLQNKPNSEANGNVVPPPGASRIPWYFNHGYDSAPLTLFFDGHVSLMSVAEAMDADERATCDEVNGLWSRTTPMLDNGYYGDLAYDTLANTSFHILTLDGVLGRDSLGAK